MKGRILLSWLLLLVVCGCAQPPAVTLLPPTVRTVAVFPPNNRTGDPLLIAGASFYEKYVARTDRITVPDVLASEARRQLARRGFTVVSPELVDAMTGDHPPTSAQDAAAVAARNQLEAAVLYIDVRRWEVDVPVHPTFVIASVEVALVDPTNGNVLWTMDHPSRPVATPGVVNLGDAYAIAARTLIQQMLAALGSERPTPADE
ncbi:MAG TPA: hypothetical protein VF515_06655 [Candidatus Binatia bacterium]|jgi:hypothetical protein